MSQYTVYVTPDAWEEIKRLPGNMRQRVRRQVEALANNPQPTSSKQLHISGIEPSVWRIRLDRWRIIYTLSESDQAVDVLNASCPHHLLAPPSSIERDQSLPIPHTDTRLRADWPPTTFA